MKQFWREHSSAANVEEMMLDSQAHTLGEYEVPEVRSLMPSCKAKDVLELGAGIGRFTGYIGKEANSVKAIDFIQKFIDKNKEINGHLNNIVFQQADVTELVIPGNSVDVIFSNWLLMYLTDSEVMQLFNNMLTWLRPGGMLFFRESCFHQSGDKKRNDNPTQYRSPAQYNSLLAESYQQLDSDKIARFSLLRNRSIQAYIKLKNNRNQLCWLLQKEVMESKGRYQGFKTFQEFLDNKQYSRNGILCYEYFFGQDFVSTGGRDTTEEFVAHLDLKAGQQVLDVGVGIGGSAFYMAKNFDVHVHGMDLSSNMIEIAMERAEKYQSKKVDFEIADATLVEYPTEKYDVVYSRDTILHIKDKLALFKNFHKCLKPGGKLLISDYCCGEAEWAEDFAAYVADRGYHLLSVPQYGQVIQQAGFTDVVAQDRTDLFVMSLKKELARTDSIKEDFLKKFTQQDLDGIMTGWEEKVKRCARGDQRWGFFLAQKPLR